MGEALEEAGMVPGGHAPTAGEAAQEGRGTRTCANIAGDGHTGQLSNLGCAVFALGGAIIYQAADYLMAGPLDATAAP